MSRRVSPTRGRPGPGALLLAALVAVAVLAACVGSISKEALDEEMRSRGGNGIGEHLVVGAVEAVMDDLGADDIELRSLTASPARVTMEVRVPGTENLDAYSFGTSGLYGGRGLDGPRPLTVSADAPPLETQVFLASNAGLDRFDEMVDTALAEASLPGGYVDGATVRRFGEGSAIVIAIDVTGERSRATVSFAADGSLMGVEQS